MQKVLEDYIRMCYDGFLQGWHERNGGNLTYRMREEEAASCAPLFSQDRHIALPVEVPALRNEYFITTGSGRYMRNVPLAPQENIGIIRIDDDGRGYTILWGLEGGARPTSELPSHLLNHVSRMEATGGKCRVIYHAHPANITALSYTIEPDAKTLSRILWQSETECAVVFPEGVGILDWMIPGGTDIAAESAKLIRKYPAIVWAFHGIFGSGETFDETFGLVHTIEKAAEIYLKAKGAGIIRTISDDQLRILASAFGVRINEDFLN